MTRRLLFSWIGSMMGFMISSNQAFGHGKVERVLGMGGLGWEREFGAGLMPEVWIAGKGKKTFKAQSQSGLVCTEFQKVRDCLGANIYSDGYIKALHFKRDAKGNRFCIQRDGEKIHELVGGFGFIVFVERPW